MTKDRLFHWIQGNASKQTPACTESMKFGKRVSSRLNGGVGEPEGENRQEISKGAGFYQVRDSGSHPHPGPEYPGLCHTEGSIIISGGWLQARPARRCTPTEYPRKGWPGRFRANPRSTSRRCCGILLPRRSRDHRPLRKRSHPAS